MAKSICYTLGDPEGYLSDILDLVHDRSVDFSEIEFDGEAGMLTIPLTVLEAKPKSYKKKWFLFKVGDYKELNAKLKVKGVSEWRCDDPDQIGVCVVNTISMENGKFNIIGSTPGLIEGSGARISIELIVFDYKADLTLSMLL